VLKEQVLQESLDIMLWALQQHDPQGWLATDPHAHAQQMALIKACDEEFKPQLDRYKYPNRFELTDGLAARQAACLFLTQLHHRLTQSVFLSGSTWGLADAAIAPFVRQFAHTDPEWFAAQSWPELIQWLNHFESSEQYQACMHKYKVWHAGNKPVAFPAV
jgi:glutathione S-transferase